MKYYKQWTQTETLFSAYLNLRKAYTPKYIVRADHGRIFIWTNEEYPKLLITVFVEPSVNAEQQSFQELSPDNQVKQFRLCGSSLHITEELNKHLP